MTTMGNAMTTMGNAMLGENEMLLSQLGRVLEFQQQDPTTTKAAFVSVSLGVCTFLYQGVSLN